MAIRVLHIFSPNYAGQFGGGVIRWKFCFSHWDDAEVMHYVLDTSRGRLVDARRAFEFTYGQNQRALSRRERLSWIVSLLVNLQSHRGEYDLLHVHKLWWGGLLVGPWANISRIPAVYESIMADSDSPAGISRERLSRIKLACLRSYSRILTVSEQLATDYRRAGFERRRVTTVLNCVDTKMFEPVNEWEDKASLRRQLGLPTRDTLVLFVGTAVKRKGIDVLIRAFVEASSSNRNLFLLIVGPANAHEDPGVDRELLDQLEHELSGARTPRKHRFVGLVQDKSLLSSYYRASDLFVLPSGQEGLPNAVLEAMSSGLPAIVARIPALEGVIVHQRNGVFVPAGDVPALAKAMLSIASDGARSRKLGSYARRYVLRHHTFSGWQDRIVKVYSELTAGLVNKDQ